MKSRDKTRFSSPNVNKQAAVIYLNEHRGRREQSVLQQRQGVHDYVMIWQRLFHIIDPLCIIVSVGFISQRAHDVELWFCC